MTEIERGERGMLSIMSAQLEITEQLLGHYIKLVLALRQNPSLVGHLPAIPSLKELQALRSSTSQLQKRVRTILDLL